MGYKQGLQKRKEKPKANNQDENMKHTFLPYIQGTTYIIDKILKQKHIRTSFYPQNFLRNMLDRVKYPIDPKSRKGIYSIMWSCDEIFFFSMEKNRKYIYLHSTYDLKIHYLKYTQP